MEEAGGDREEGEAGASFLAHVREEEEEEEAAGQRQGGGGRRLLPGARAEEEEAEPPSWRAAGMTRGRGGRETRGGG